MKSTQIRQAFLDYFATKGHQVVPSSSLIPGQDPTLLFTNAGMVQFKDTFLGLEPRPYTRATSAQRCLRAGGKHNDLENVGYTARHHTFFEMLGNFSFGDYFKREAIQYAWEFLTSVLQLPPERLWVTVYEKDDEAADIWLKEIGIPADRLSRCGEKDNFWSMGDTGPCGPCTEIFYDHGASIPGGPPGSPEADGDRYIEIWNVVFMQFNRDSAGHLHRLPTPSVDTGMGLERIAAVMQGVHNNYDIDSFSHLIKAIYAKLPQSTSVSLDHPSLKVIADHIRACSFLIADGVIPGNEGRSYVLRRIIRRAVRHGHQLGLAIPFFSQLVKPLIEVMGDAYPELMVQEKVIIKWLSQEEQQFSRTLDQGLRLLHEVIEALDGSIIPGEVVFKLYDTYGFPVDLTADIARERGLSIDMDAFERCMAIQREQSSAASGFRVDHHARQLPLLYTTSFEGYAHDAHDAKVLALVVDGKEELHISSGTRASVVLDKTPFYAESGGQVGDSGGLYTLDGEKIFRVDDTQKIGHTIVHHGEMIASELHVSAHVVAQIDEDKREAIRANHTATHLLHAALRAVLGDHVQQKGSLVEATRARFDFSHPDAMTAVQLEHVEALVNEHIRENHDVLTNIMSMDDAAQSGAMALFGEKYSDMVRVLSMGDFSTELCGGTHATRTGDIGLFKITAEYGVASGVRRIEMVTGQYALNWVNDQVKTIAQIAQQLKATPADVVVKLEQYLAETKQQERQLLDAKRQLTQQQGKTLLNDVQQISNMNVLIKRLDDVDADALRLLLDGLRSSLPDAVIVLVGVTQQKMHVVVGVSKSLKDKAPSAATLVKYVCGKGGGRDDMAQGGGVLPADLDEKLKQMASMLQSGWI